MLEIPEAYVIAKQLDETIKGKRIKSACANSSPHSFAWYMGDPGRYGALLSGHTVTGACAHAGFVDIALDGAMITINDGVNARFLTPADKTPAKHQLLLEFDDGARLVCTVAMYGGIYAYEGSFINEYYAVAMEKPSPLTDAFDEAYFASLRSPADDKLTMKAFLATNQRIPGLGNGVLQDILYRAHLHPKRKLATVGADEYAKLFRTLKDTLREMTERGGRDVEKDVYGKPGGYKTQCSKLTVDTPCPICGHLIEKQAYLGGAVYFCPECQGL